VFLEKIASYYVAFVGFQHFLAKLVKIGGQETPFLKRPILVLFSLKKSNSSSFFFTDFAEMKRLHSSSCLKTPGRSRFFVTSRLLKVVVCNDRSKRSFRNGND
jgi:hypothetical protein